MLMHCYAIWLIFAYIVHISVVPERDKRSQSTSKPWFRRAQKPGINRAGPSTLRMSVKCTAEQAGDAAEIDLQRKRALELGDQNLTLLKQETVLLRRVLALDTGAEEEVSIVTQDGKKIRATLHDGRLDLNTIKKELVNEGWGLCLLDGVIPSCYHNGLSCSKFKPGSVIQVVIQKKRGSIKTFEAYPGARSSWWPFNLFS
ncbi:hypothetical protein WJX82_009753 [Trebouxia sp. C0006]